LVVVPSVAVAIKRTNDPSHEYLSAESGEESSPNESPAAAERVRSETSQQRPPAFARNITPLDLLCLATKMAFFFFVVVVVVDRFE
jgi:hypothetical protein